MAIQAPFVFICYRKWSSLVFWNRNGTASILHSIEGMLQGGGPLAMISYRIVIFPLIKNLKWAIPGVTQPWYANKAGFLGTFARLETYLDFLKFQDPGQGYRPEQFKSVLIVHLENIKAGKVFGRHHGFRVCTCSCYLQGYIVDDESKRDWFRERTLPWENNINIIRETTGKHPQNIYTAMVRTIQSEWLFLQRITWETGDLFAGWRR